MSKLKMENVLEQHMTFDEQLRVKRTPLLEAFDRWEKAVIRGREQDDEIIMQWFTELLKLNPTAFNSVPERVKYYVL